MRQVATTCVRFSFWHGDEDECDQTHAAFDYMHEDLVYTKNKYNKSGEHSFTLERAAWVHLVNESKQLIAFKDQSMLVPPKGSIFVMLKAGDYTLNLNVKEKQRFKLAICEGVHSNGS